MPFTNKNRSELILDGDNKGAVRAIRGVTTELEKGDSVIRGFGTSAGGTFGALLNPTLLFAGAMSAATFGLVQFGREAITMASEAEGVSKAFNRISNSTQLMYQLENATKSTMSQLELMKLAVNATNFRIPMETLVKGLEFAKIRANETGQSIDYMLNSFVTGLGRQSVKILDNLGISAIEIQKEVKKVGDFGVAVGNIMDRELSKMDRGFISTKDKVAQLNKELDDTKVQLGEKITPAWAAFLGWANEELQLTINAFKDPGERIRQTGEDVSWMNGNIKRTADGLIIIKNNSKAAGETVDEIKQKIANLTTALGETIIGSKDYYDTLAEIKAQQDKLNESTSKLAQQWETTSKSLNMDIAKNSLSELAFKFYQVDVKLDELYNKFGQRELIDQWAMSMKLAIADINKISVGPLVGGIKMPKFNIGDMITYPKENPIKPFVGESIGFLTDFFNTSNEGSAQMREIAANNFSAMSQASLGLFNAMGNHEKAFFAMHKTFAVANAIVSTYSGAAKALEQGGFFGIAMAAAVITTGLLQVATILATNPGSTAGGAPPAQPAPPQTRDLGSSTSSGNGQRNLIVNLYVNGVMVTDGQSVDKFTRDYLGPALNKAIGDGHTIYASNLYINK